MANMKTKAKIIKVDHDEFLPMKKANPVLSLGNDIKDMKESIVKSQDCINNLENFINNIILKDFYEYRKLNNDIQKNNSDLFNIISKHTDDNFNKVKKGFNLINIYIIILLLISIANSYFIFANH